MADYQVYFRLDNGSWFGSAPGADPVANTGGMDLSAMAGTTMYPAVQGTGDAGITVNFGASAFSFPVPSGYVAGWPHSGGGFTTLDPSKLFGSAALGSGNLVAGFASVPGLAQAVDGYATGKYYFELVNPTGDLFSADWGGGIGQNFAVGGNLNEWFSNGRFSSSNNLGGGLIGGQNLAHELSSLAALGSNVLTDVFNFAANANHVVGVAVFLTSAPPPPPAPTPGIVVPPNLGRWRGQCGINWNGLALVGDAFSNVVGLSDFQNFNEYGNRIEMLATAPPIHEDRKRIFVSRFEVEVEAGLGIPGSPQTAPLLVLDYSKDGGITFKPLQQFRSMGAAGEYVKRLRWINIGESRTWVFRIRYSDAARPTIIGTYYDSWKGLG
jgi:hypothetical protein